MADAQKNQPASSDNKDKKPILGKDGKPIVLKEEELVRNRKDE